MTRCIVLSFLFFTTTFFAQQEQVPVLNFEEYLGYVKKYHPIAKQAALVISQGEANLMKARGGFDPKLEVDYDSKQFKGSEYYDVLNTTFKIPTWYGLEFKAGYERNEGVFLNPQNNVPDDGLFNAGVTLSLGKGLWMNKRMAVLQKAKAFSKQAEADQDLLINEILHKAAIAYFDWLRAYRETTIFDDFVVNSKTRLEGVKKSALAGDRAIIDTVEARIAYQNRALSLEQAQLKFVKSSMELSNFLWLEGNVPVELQPNVIPDLYVEERIDQALQIQGTAMESFVIEEHPKMRSLGYKIENLNVDRRLKANLLLPVIDVTYNFLTETPDFLSSYDTEQYKGGLTFKLPLFLRKERGDLKLAKLKLMDAEFDRYATQLQIQNKVSAIFTELKSLDKQTEMIQGIVGNYNTMLAAEERKFSFGESSLFLVNSREKSLIDAQLKQIGMQNKLLYAKAKLFKVLAINPTGI